MKKVIRLTESDLINIINKVISEQTITLAGRAGVAPRFNLSKPKPFSGKPPPPRDNPAGEIPCEYQPKERVEELFKDAKTWNSSAKDWVLVKPIAEEMKKQMEGLGSGNVVDLFKKIDTKEKLAALIKNWNYNNESLYQWLSDEMFVSWTTLVEILNGKFASYLPYCRPGCECPWS